jgi:predicted O-methyltransferase YrrM
MGSLASKLKSTFQFIKYRIYGQTKHDIHSPFVFDLLTWVIEDTTPFYKYSAIESLRAQLLLSQKTLSIVDYGAGSSINTSRKRTIASVARHSLKPAKYAQLLFRLVRHFKPDNIVELGTSLGITTLYLAAPRSNARVHTLEGCPETALIAKSNFERLQINNIQIVTGDFNKTLSKTLSSLSSLDFVFFDGNHQKQATLNYFNQCLPYISSDSVLVFDDIYWSNGMQEAWEAIKRHPKVTVTIDLYAIGIVFFRKVQEKQHFTIKF